MFRIGFIWILAVFLLSPPLLAATATISGSITEPSGSACAYATITLTDRGSGTSHSVTADEGGAYRASDLSTGSYDIEAVSPRTRASASSALDVQAGEDLVLPLRLAGGWTVFEVQDPSSVSFVGSNYLDSLPRGAEITRGEEGGNVEGYGPYSPRGDFGVNSIGQRSQDNNFQVDGMDNNEPWLRGPVLNPSPELIDSVTLTAVYTPATEGHQTGAVINVVTRSGASSWHGEGVDYVRNSVLDARNFFDGASKPGTTQNQFGGSLGGPLPGKNWFFFANANALRARDGLTVVSTVPTAAEKAGNFGGEAIYDPLSIAQTTPTLFIRQPFALNRIPLSVIPVQARNLIGLYPDPNLPGLADNFRFTPSSINNGERYALRTDKTLSSRDRLFVRLNYERFDNQSPSALPGNAGSDITQHANDADIRIGALGAAAGQTFVIGPTVSNELRAGFTRFDWNGAAADQNSNDAALLAIPGLGSGGLPVVSPEGYAQLGAAQGLPATMRSTSYELRDAVSWLKGRHSLVAGLQMVRRHLDGDATDYTSRGTFSFTPDYTDQPNTP
jgi:hypothetical protein